MENAVQLLNTKGNLLASILYPGSKKHLIILCHGFGGCKDDFGIKHLALSLNKQGYTTFIFDFTGQGKSEGNKEFDLQQQVEDLEVVINSLRSEYSQISVLGGSMGGLISTLVAVKRKDIAHLILVNPFLYLYKKISWRDTKYLIGTIILYPFSKRVRSIYSCYFTYFRPRKLTSPTLIIVGKNDKRVSPTHSHEFFTHISSPKELIKDNAIDHELSIQLYVDIVSNYVVSWLNSK